MEPGFYVCQKCGRRWQRYEYKMRANPPRVCPYENCGGTEHKVDQKCEDEYVREVYGPLAQALLGSARKDGT